MTGPTLKRTVQVILVVLASRQSPELVIVELRDYDWHRISLRHHKKEVYERRYHAALSVSNVSSVPINVLYSLPYPVTWKGLSCVTNEPHF